MADKSPKILHSELLDKLSQPVYSKNAMTVKHDATRERILNAGMELVPLMGYNATGLEAILKKAGVPKGSFYHFFRTKQEFGLELLARAVAQSEQIRDRFLNDQTKEPLARIDAYLDYVIDLMGAQGCTRGCFVGNLSQELSDQNEAFRLALTQVFEQWEEKITLCLKEAQDCGELDKAIDCRALGRFFFSAFEGALLQAKVLRSVAPLRDLKEFWLHGVRLKQKQI
ncbi:MAG: TetR family transcriptional regulator C-terminal domain-containing protein [Desulfovibrionaceae bacterium]|nr:TetR family transcriptional regulator C-terminal domain-containing protein [Desulfovibrionaceae bacterium]